MVMTNPKIFLYYPYNLFLRFYIFPHNTKKKQKEEIILDIFVIDHVISTVVYIDQGKRWFSSYLETFSLLDSI